MVNIESIIARLQALEEYSDYLRDLRRVPLSDVKTDIKNRWAIERGLLLAIESILDIGSHIVADEKLGRPKDYTEIIDVLGDKDVIPKDYAEQIRGIAGFRNILIHEYVEIDIEKVYEYLQKAPEQFDTFRFHIGKFLKL
ncbi:MAG: DUF86 domain-containing protein [Candidatus Aquicultor sp.]|nr:DUF86 domain-containing protein [Candidatus Aquicultor sp.]